MRSRLNLERGAPVSVFGRRGGSPLQVCALRPVTEGNCVAARRGGKQPEVKNRSAGDELDSACCCDEPAGLWRSPLCGNTGKPVSLRGSVLKVWRGSRGWLEVEPRVEHGAG